MKLRRHSGGTACRHGHVIGVDLGATAVRVAVLSTRPENVDSPIRIEQLGSVALAPGVVVNGAVADPGALSAALQELWRTYDIGCRHVVLGVAGTQVQVRELQVPDLDPVRRAQALPFQAREVVALPMDQVVLDFAPLGEPAEDSHLVDGLLVASPREPVRIAVAAVEAAGLRVTRVDLSSFALLRAIAQEGLASEAVVDLGAQLTTVVVHRDGVPTMVRTLARGGEELTRRLAQKLEINPDEADELKRLHGLAGSPEVAAALRGVLTPLLTDIRTSLNYFRSSHADTPIEHVSLTGGGARLPGLAEVLGDHVGAPASVTDPARMLGPIPMTSDAPVEPSALSVGLALGVAA